MPELYDVFQKLGIALGMGLLVGLQREKASSSLAGIRTFPLITVLGAIVALLAGKFGGWVVVGGLTALAAMLVVGNCVKLKTQADVEPGITTEVAALLMFCLGAYAVVGHALVAVAVGAGAAVLLHWKRPLHALLDNIAEKDMKAIMQFVLIALVVLPILPNKSFGPYDLFNPFETWLVVVMIVGISLVAYLLYQAFGTKLGTIFGGILGGLISSTATTISYAQKAASGKGIEHLSACVILIASAMAFARIIVEVFVFAPKHAPAMALPVLAPMAAIIVGAIIFMRKTTGGNAKLPPQENPAELKSAAIFGLLYTCISFAVAATKDLIGNSGLYIVAVVSGLTDVDALTVSTAQMTQHGSLAPGTASQLILLGALANLVFKGSMSALIGRVRLAKFVVPVFTAAVAVGLIAVFMIPPATKAVAGTGTTIPLSQ